MPFDSTNFMERRIHPIADRLGIPRRLVTFQVMRRTVATDLQFHGTLQDAQTVLRHASPDHDAFDLPATGVRKCHSRAERADRGGVRRREQEGGESPSRVLEGASTETIPTRPV